MAWAKNETKAGDGTGGYTTGSYTETKFNMLMTYNVNTTSNIQYLRPNTDTGAQYAERTSDDGGTPDDTVTSSSNGIPVSGTSTTPTFAVGYFIDIASKEKLFIIHSVEQNTAGNAPSRREIVGKLVDTTRITSMDVNPSAGNNTTDSNVTILGTD